MHLIYLFNKVTYNNVFMRYGVLAKSFVDFFFRMWVIEMHLFHSMSFLQHMRYDNKQFISHF